MTIPITHVVVLMMENHSFDRVLGALVQILGLPIWDAPIN
jgi:phospholipase C